MSNYFVNPTANDGTNFVYQNDGSTAITRTSTVINGGTAKNLGSNRSLLDDSGLGLGDKSKYGSIVLGGIFGGDITSANVGAAQTVFSVSSGQVGNTYYAQFVDSGHGLSVGNILDVNDSINTLDGIARVLQVNDANTITVSIPAAASTGTVTYRVGTGNFATLTAGAYVIRRDTDTIHGVSNTIIRSGGTNPGLRRSINKIETGMRHDGSATAVRAGYWNIYSGSWDTAPTATNNSIYTISDADTNDPQDADNAANPSYSVPGELVYRIAGRASATGVVMADYPAKNG